MIAKWCAGLSFPWLCDFMASAFNVAGVVICSAFVLLLLVVLVRLALFSDRRQPWEK